MNKTELLALADALAEYDAEAAHRGVSFEPTRKITAALREYAATLGQEPVAKMNMPLIWLYSHCRALGMTKHSDSGELEHDIALFVADLKDAAIRKGEAP